MLSRPIDLLRNIGIIAHIDAGKTTCAERILFHAGRIHRAGDVHHGTTTLDYDPMERKMGITITSAATSFPWTPRSGSRAGALHGINLIDTPGHVDFTIEVERSLRVLDGAIAVFDAGNGVEPQSETVWRQADRYGVPRVAFVNKMDKVGASFADCVASIRERLGATAVPVQLPIGEEGSHRGVVDLLRRRAFVFRGVDRATVFEEQDVPADMVPAVEQARADLVLACAEIDDAVLARYIESGAADVGAGDLERALRAGTLSLRLVPVLCGSAHKYKGIQMLLDAVCAYLPSPAEAPRARGHDPESGREVERAADDAEPFCGLAFKAIHLDRAGLVTLIRVYSGRIRSGTTVLNATTGRKERVGRLVTLHADKVTDITVSGAGSIVAAIGFRQVRTGDTLTAPDQPLVLAGLSIPEPVVEAAIEPRTAADEERLSVALARLAVEDPSFRVSASEDTGQTILRGMGELHLTILVDRLARDHGVEVVTGQPSVSYRETVLGRGEAEYTLSKQNGGPGQYARVLLGVAPGARGSGLVFRDRSRGGAVPRQLVPAVEQGIRGAMSRGVLSGHPVVDVEVELLDGTAHAVDSKPPAFEVAASMAFRRAAERAGVCLLEPIMTVEVTTPADYLGEVLGDLHARRGDVQSVTERGRDRVVTALVPLRALFGHIGDLRGRTQGRASAAMRPSHYHYAPAAPGAAGTRS